MLTAKGEDVDRIVGLEMGADDYLPKPFNPRELVARIHAVLRRHGERAAPGAPTGEGRVPFGDHRRSTSPPARSSATARSTTLTTGEFSLIKVFAQHPRQPLAREKLMLLARGRDHEVFDRAIDVQVSRLRKLVEPDPGEPALHPDRLGLRLRVRAARRRARRDARRAARRRQSVTLWPRSLFGRLVLLLVAVVALAALATIAAVPPGPRRADRAPVRPTPRSCSCRRCARRSTTSTPRARRDTLDRLSAASTACASSRRASARVIGAPVARRRR